MTAAPLMAANRGAKFYRAAWRWHFYAGLFVVPFFLVLAVTGMMMLWIAHLDGRDGERIPVTPQGQTTSLNLQAAVAIASVPDGQPVQYVAPRAPGLAAIFRIDGPDGPQTVAVDPYTAQVVTSFPRQAGWYDLADGIHSSLLLGVTGDRMLEIAASLGVVLLATGLYLWWPRQGGIVRAMIPNLAARGRALWRSLHGVVGIWISVVLMFFLVSGLAWSGVWGEKLTQAWSTFPAAKWDAVPLSDATHGSRNDGPKQVAWALEQTPLPASGSAAGAVGIAEGQPVTIDSVDALARQIGFDGRYQLILPKGDTGVWTLTRDSMNSDSLSPTTDRTVHVDQYTGRILADVGFADYSWAGKAMAVGIALHMGTLGLWSVLANTVFCLAVIFLCVSGVVLWWKRRPVGQWRLAPPPMPADMPLWRGAMVLACMIGVAFPMAGVAMAAAIAIDRLILARIPAFRRVFG
ncbi:PepSY-associated TM helix domain-containing protein [Paracoccus sediminilitoris]|uniref:PepSY-associated TM helix domain-containing protein n=1 Tax=Paracoccus sediminilitoris TaxID=2202419 RepID=UPI00272B6F0A|nr:PepSY domain-containing protein [Paracoccus sediminilitoris]